MLNNGHGGIGTPENPHQSPHHQMYGGGGPGHPGGGGPMEYGGPPNSYNMGPSPPSMNGMSGHHSGGYCSQMSVNQNNACPPSNQHLKTCSGCSGPILERYLLFTMDRYWHHNCLRCSQCNLNLADVGNSCFTREGMVLCRNDYQRLFGGGTKACNGCGVPIPSSELVMRAGVADPRSNLPYVYHLKCFTCCKCNHGLQPGERYSVLSGALYCENDALKVMKNNGIGSPSNAQIVNTNGPAVPPKKGKVGRPRRSRD